MLQADASNPKVPTMCLLLKLVMMNILFNTPMPNKVSPQIK
jgi:hypothetical protein